MILAHELWAEILAAAGPKKLRDFTGYDISTLYSFARNPMDAQDPDGTGARGILDRFEATVDLLASRASSRVTLRKLQCWTNSLLENALDRGERVPVDPKRLNDRAVHALRELADVIDACAKEQRDCARIVSEVLEVQSILDEILRAAESGLVAERVGRAPLRPVS